ncbi:ATP-binding cassette sub- A member 1 [Chytriomyces hyalinus]|nr:ATP-binding cassette sub- A member 1 [Chytriomyces hyalinus]
MVQTDALQEFSLDGLKTCLPRGGNDGCVTIMWSQPDFSQLSNVSSVRYGESMYAGIIQEFARMNVARCAGSSAPDIEQAVSDTLLLNIEYIIWHNASAAYFKSGGDSVFEDILLRLLRGLDEAIASYLNRDSGMRPDFNATIRDWPKVFPEFTSNVAQTSGPAFLVCTTILVFISSIHEITSEKESELYAAVRVSGVQPHTYAITHLISRVFIVTVNALVTVLAGTFVFQFRLFKNASMVALLSSFVSFGVAMEAMALFVASSLESAEPAVLAGTAVFVNAILLQTFVFSDGYYGYILYNPVAASPVIWKVLTIFPFFNFGKLLLDFITYTHGKRNPVTGGYVAGPGFTLASFVESVPADLLPVYSHGTEPDPPAPILSLLLLWMNVVLFSSAAIVWEMFKSGFTIKRFSSAFFRGSYAVDSTRTIIDIERVDSAKPPCDSSDPVMSIRNLKKTFRSGNLFQRKSNAAVDGLDFDLYSGEIFALVGKSGVGKTTLTSILTRQLAPDSGSLAFHNNRPAYQSIGVCPQTDILFPDMTAREHVVLYSALRGVALIQNGDAALESINLTKSGDRLVRGYSGGDETNCAIVLTTYSIDEVEALADRVGIMSAGKFCAVGCLKELKKRHDARGFRVSVAFGAVEQKEMVKEAVHGLGIEVRVEDEARKNIVFRVVEKSGVAQLVLYLEKQKLLILGWSIAPVTLDDVFMDLVG